MKKIILIAMFLVLVAAPAFAQSDFPFYPGAAPSSQPFIPGVYPWQSSSTVFTGSYGETTLWGVTKGSTVFFDFVMDWWGLAIVSVSPRSDQGDDFHYLDDNQGAAGWYHGEAGYWCLRCAWSFRATEDNPTIRLDYMGSPNWGAHIEVTNVAPLPVIPSPTPFVSQDAKNLSAGLSTATFAAANAALGAAAVSCSVGTWQFCGLFSIVGIGLSWATFNLETIANDPWDPEYGSYYSWSYNSDEANSYSPLYCQWGIDYDTSNGWLPSQICQQLIDIQLGFNGLAKGAAVTADRFQSCIDVGDSCFNFQRDTGVSYMQATGAYMYELGLYYRAFAEYLSAVGYFNDGYDITAWMEYVGSKLISGSYTFMAVQ